MAAYYDAVQQKVVHNKDNLQTKLNQYQDTPKWAGLAERKHRDYVGHILRIEERFGDFPIRALTDCRARAEFLSWRDEMARKSRRQAGCVFATFASILVWAYDRGLPNANPCERPGKLYRAKRSEAYGRMPMRQPSSK
ncbi:hypothetical protein [Ruegeria arenilitoris]|uniref:hypothetical protein n=1 Tax=Ruegeria arenilitoris TaxID=1173585 RepID=UPI0020C210E3|nr:hypothetical protein [Ruegeria arenilitoris]